MIVQTHANLRERRTALGLSRPELARAADISAISIKQLEAGWRPKRSRVLHALVATLGRLEAEQLQVLTKS